MITVFGSYVWYIRATQTLCAPTSDTTMSDGQSARRRSTIARCGVIGQPSSFAIDGRQYIAVQSGWGIDARGMQTRLNTARPGEFPEVPEGGALWVFAVD
jgi:hypothetical protein